MATNVPSDTDYHSDPPPSSIQTRSKTALQESKRQRKPLEKKSTTSHEKQPAPAAEELESHQAATAQKASFDPSEFLFKFMQMQMEREERLEEKRRIEEQRREDREAERREYERRCEEERRLERDRLLYSFLERSQKTSREDPEHAGVEKFRKFDQFSYDATQLKTDHCLHDFESETKGHLLSSTEQKSMPITSSTHSVEFPGLSGSSSGSPAAVPTPGPVPVASVSGVPGTLPPAPLASQLANPALTSVAQLSANITTSSQSNAPSSSTHALGNISTSSSTNVPGIPAPVVSQPAVSSGATSIANVTSAQSLLSQLQPTMNLLASQIAAATASSIGTPPNLPGGTSLSGTPPTPAAANPPAEESILEFLKKIPKIYMPEHWSPHCTIPLRTWLSNVKQCLEDARAPDSLKVPVALHLMDALSQEILSNANVSRATSWAEFHKLAHIHLGISDSSIYWQTQLDGISQRVDEPAAKFANRVVQTALYAWPELDATTRQKMVLQRFARGLANPVARQHLEAAIPHGTLQWSTAIEIAQTMETSSYANPVPSLTGVVNSGTVSQAQFTWPQVRPAAGPRPPQHNSYGNNSYQPRFRYPQQRSSEYSQNNMTNNWNDSRQSGFQPPPYQPRGWQNNAPFQHRNNGYHYNRYSSHTQNRSNTSQNVTPHISNPNSQRSVNMTIISTDVRGGNNKILPVFANADERRHVTSWVTLDGVTLKTAIIDTGASRSIISSTALNYIREQQRSRGLPLTEEKELIPSESIEGVSRQIIQVSRHIIPVLNITGVTVRHSILVLENTPVSILIGMDILRPHRAFVDVTSQEDYIQLQTTCEICHKNENRNLQAKQIERPVPLSSRNELPHILLLNEPKVLSPNSTQIVRVAIPDSLRRHSYLVETTGCFVDRCGAGVLPVVVPAGNQDTHLSLLLVNPNSRSTQIPVKTPLVRVVLIEESSREFVVTEANSTKSQSAPLTASQKFSIISNALNLNDLPVQPEVRASFSHLVEEFIDIFSTSDSDVGETQLIYHEIDTGYSKPIRQSARRIPYGEQRVEVEKQTNEMIRTGLVRPSNSAWASPIVLVRKKDGTWRMCIDYRKLNDLTKKDAYPLPRIDEALAAFAGCDTFSSMDLNKAYHQVPVDPSDVEKTAFVTHEGLFEYTRMPFGLCNAPATYQRLMNRVLNGLLFRYCISYLDDIIVYSRGAPDHLLRLREVFVRLRTAHLKLKPSKCHFLQPEVRYLGHIVSGTGIQVDPEKTRAIREFPTPTTTRELRGFLGLANYYADFVEGFAQIAAPLYSLSNGTEPLQFDTVARTALENLKAALCNAPVLAHPDTTRPFRLTTDASNIAVGAVLSQIQPDGSERPVEYYSAKLSPTETKWSVYERECYAVIRALKRFKIYLLANRFLLRTDHAAIKWLGTHEPQSAKQARWLTIISEFSFDIEHIRGTQNVVADALSRAPANSTLQEGISNYVAIAISDSFRGFNWNEEQKNDATCNRIRDLLARKEDIPEDEDLTEYRNEWNALLINDDLLKRQHGDTIQTVVPISIRPDIIEKMHQYVGHSGTDKTRSVIEQRFWWPHLGRDVENHVKCCPVCERDRTQNPLPHNPIEKLPGYAPFSVLYVDIVGGQTSLTDGGGPRSILAIIDGFTGWAEAVPLYSETAQCVADAIIETWISRYGVPERIHSDRGSQFESHLVQHLCERLQMLKSRTTAYRPQANGIVERFNKTLVNILRKLVQDQPENWVRQLPFALLAYRVSISRTRGETPYRMVFGREMRMPPDLDSPECEEVTPSEYIVRLNRSLSDAFASARAVSGESYRRRVDTSSRDVVKLISPGDLVRYSLPPRAGGLPAKFSPRWSRPVSVVSVSGGIVKLWDSVAKRNYVVHRDRIRKVPMQNSFHQPVPPGNWRDTNPVQRNDQSDDLAAAPNNPVAQPAARPEATPHPFLRSSTRKITLPHRFSDSVISSPIYLK